jgi:hypothetical protein
MRKTDETAMWVAYRMTIKGQTQMNAVCKQEEWEAMERDRPGHHTLIRAGMINATDAEKLARSSPVPCDTIKPTALKGTSH